MRPRTELELVVGGKRGGIDSLPFVPGQGAVACACARVLFARVDVESPSVFFIVFFGKVRPPIVESLWLWLWMPSLVSHGMIRVGQPLGCPKTAL
jgi:hypothetical protein